MDKTIKLLQELQYHLLTDTEMVKNYNIQQPILKILLGVQWLVENYKIEQEHKVQVFRTETKPEGETND